MKTPRLLVWLLLLAGMTILYTGCKKDETNTDVTKTDTSAAQDNFMAESAFDNATLWSDLAMAGRGFKSSLYDTVYMGTCVLATLDLSGIPYKLTIDFGTTNCLCDDQKYRRGKIYVYFTGSYWAAGTVISYQFEDYFINDNHILGTKTVTNKGRNAGDHLWWETVTNGSVIKSNNGGTFTWISTRQHEWTEGEGTITQWWDDVYMITGSASGMGTNGKAYGISITTALRKKLNCEWLQNGIMGIQVQDLPLITLDYGNGECDNDAFVTVNGQTFTIQL